jgi:hypothetical protein
MGWELKKARKEYAQYRIAMAFMSNNTTTIAYSTVENRMQ